MLGTGALIPIHDQNPTRSFSYVTVGLIVINALAFFATPQFGVGASCAVGNFFYEWGLIPWEFSNSQQLAGEVLQGCGELAVVKSHPFALTVLTSMFLHGGWAHIIGNMLFLWVFGNNIEDALGKIRFIVLYLITGVAAAAAHMGGNPESVIPTVGASGAVSGMLGAYVVLFPKARITTLVPIFIFWQFIQLPAILVIGFWFISQFFIGQSQPVGGGGIAWLAHVGGFIAGMVLIIPFGGRSGIRRGPRPSGWSMD